MHKKGHIPERTCVVCRKKNSKWNLLRFCVYQGKIIWDKEQKKGGRGAYTCLECVKKLRNKKLIRKFFNALRIERTPELEESLKEVIKKFENEGNKT